MKRNANDHLPVGACKRDRAVSVLLQPSPAQVRKLYDHDNKCAHQYMGIPLRVCNTEEPADQPSAIALSDKRMADLLNEIDDMWRKCSAVFESFTDPKEPHLGCRLRVAKKLPMKLNIKENDRMIVGWKVMCPENGPSSHLYERSLMYESHQYLGGPISYCNWSLQETVTVRQVNHGPQAHLVRAEVKNKAAGTELLWNYGIKSKETSFSESDWFKAECCTISSIPLKRIRLLQSEVYQDLCVLCGMTYRSEDRDATKRKPQKKVHYIQFHSNFLGSDWDGHGDFSHADHVVDADCAQLEAERLNRLLQRLQQSNWRVLPACCVLDEEEMSLDSEEVLEKFRQACNLLKKCGVVVIRGRRTATTLEDLNPVSCMTWSDVFPHVKKSYAMLPQEMIDRKEELENWAIQDAMMVLNLDPNPVTGKEK